MPRERTIRTRAWTRFMNFLRWESLESQKYFNIFRDIRFFFLCLIGRRRPSGVKIVVTEVRYFIPQSSLFWPCLIEKGEISSFSDLPWNRKLYVSIGLFDALFFPSISLNRFQPTPLPTPPSESSSSSSSSSSDDTPPCRYVTLTVESARYGRRREGRKTVRVMERGRLPHRELTSKLERILGATPV